MFHPQIKICGITQVDQALWCADLGADAIGCVFYPKSPRHLTEEKARDICRELPEEVTPVGVFVNLSLSEIMKTVNRCGLKAVQLHGTESPDLVLRLKEAGLIVVKALFIDGTPSMNDAVSYRADGYLVECSKGDLPGGNALVWNWDQARDFGNTHPSILAGGLAPDNIKAAIHAARPHGVDVSSGVESSAGVKDRNKIQAFIAAVKQAKVRSSPVNIY